MGKKDYVNNNGLTDAFTEFAARLKSTFLHKSGGIMTGKLYLQKGSEVHHVGKGTPSDTYFKVCTITITSNYQNQPILLDIIQRGGKFAKLSITFSNANNSTPNLSSFKKQGSGRDAWLVKSQPSSWDLYVQKDESYDELSVISLSQGWYMKNTIITWHNETVPTLPDIETYPTQVAATWLDWQGNATSSNSTKFLKYNNTFTSNGESGLQYYDANFTNQTTTPLSNDWNSPVNNWAQIIHMPLSVSGYWNEIAMPVNQLGIYYRQRRSSSYSGWKQILDETNYNNYSPKLNGEKAYGNWKINSNGLFPVAIVGSDVDNSQGWYKVADGDMTTYGNLNLVYLVKGNCSSTPMTGILELDIRYNNGRDTEIWKCAWITRTTSDFADSIKVVVEGTKWTMYAYNPPKRYGRISFIALQQSNINGNYVNYVNYYNSTTPEATEPIATVTSTLAGIVQNAQIASQLQTGRTISLINQLSGSGVFDGTKNITINALLNSIELSNQDLNNFKITAIYFARGQNSVLNKPNGVDSFGLIVYRTAYGFYCQELTSSSNTLSNSMKKYIRQWDGNTSTWSSWTEMKYTDTTYTIVTTTKDGLMSASDKVKLDGIETGANKYVLPPATATALGGIKVGNNLTVSSDGKLDAKDTTYSDMVGATASANGIHGLVPAPTSGNQDKFLKGDGTWDTPPDTTYGLATTAKDGLMSASMVTKLNGIAAGATKNLPTTITPKANGTAAIGSDTGYAKGDHVHPLQTTISGNAGTATKLQTGRKINNVMFDGTQDITITADPTENWVENSTSLNSIINPGFYYAGGGNTVQDKPSGVDVFGMIVYKIAIGIFIQELTDVNKKVYVRTYNSSNSAWTPWTERKFTDTTYTDATITASGLMSASDKTKLDGIETGAQKNTITGVKGNSETSYRTGNINITKANIGLGNVDNKSSATIRSEITSANVTSALGYTPLDSNLKGNMNGVAELDVNGKVPMSQLPDALDDVVEGYLSNGKFYKESTHTTEIVGETGKLYIDLSSNKIYRWSNSIFTEISSPLELGITSTTAGRGDWNKIAYDHAMAKGSAFQNGLYKITTNAQGHVTSATPVTKDDITGLNIPGEDSIGVAYGTCTTAGNVKDKVVTLIDADKWKLKAGSVIGVKFTNTNSYNSTASSPVTINVNGTGAKEIYYNTTLSLTGTNAAVYGYANRVIYYMYDGTNWVWMNHGIDANDNTIPSAYCSTAAATAAKTAACTSYILQDNHYIHVLVAIANSAQSALTLNINNKGAKPIWINGAESSATNYILPAGTYIVHYNNGRYYFRTDGKIPADISGSATKLQTARTINGVSFDGTKNITITANPTETNVRDIDLNNIMTPGFYYAGGGNNTQNKPNGIDAFGLLVYKTADGWTVQEMTKNGVTDKKWVRYHNNVEWGTWAQQKLTDTTYTPASEAPKVNGIATVGTSVKYAREDHIHPIGPATKLQTPITINGVSFDGSKNITISDNTKLPLVGGTLTGDLKFSGAKSIIWDDGNIRQRLQILDDSTPNTDVFKFQQSSNAGETFTDLMKIQDNGNVIATTFTGALAGNATSASKLQTARKITLTGAVTGSTTFDGSGDKTITTTLSNIDASKITSGTIDIARLPAAAIERVVTVPDDTARFNLTPTEVQLGDTVKVESTNKMYYVVDESKLSSEAGYVEYSAGNATTAAQLQTARKINGTLFNGTGDITTVNWGTARNIGIVNSDGSGTAITTSINGSANVNLKLPATIKATLTGNASSATKLQTARTIDGVAFDGTANIDTRWNFKVGSDTTDLSSYWFPLYIQNNYAGQYADILYIIEIGNRYNDSGLGAGLLAFGWRQNTANADIGQTGLNIEANILSGNLDASKFKIYLTTDGKVQLWVNTITRYAACVGNVIAYTHRSGNKTFRDSLGTFNNQVFTTVQTPPTGAKEYTFIYNNIASKLGTPRNINGVAFDGTKDITISTTDNTKLPLTGGTLTGITTLQTSSGDAMFMAKRTDSGTQIGFGVGAGGVNHGIYSNVHNKWIAYADNVGIYLNGNANSASKLQTARTINGVAFDGTANITIADNTKLPLAGGTMTGTINTSVITNTYLNGSKGINVLLNSTSDGGGYVTLLRKKSTNGVFTLNGYQGNLIFGYQSDNSIEAGTNSLSKSIYMNESGHFFPWANNVQNLGASDKKWSNVYATTFQGTLNGNATTATSLQTARTIDGVNFNGSSSISHYGASSTAAATAAKTVACAGFGLSVGARIIVKFTVTNTAANPSLNVNNTGAKPIQSGGVAISKDALVANSVYEFVYDGTNYQLVGGTTRDKDMTIIEKSLKVTTAWMDTGISGNNLATGSYIIQMTSNAWDAAASGGLYSELWTGMCSWYSGATNSPNADEIMLHNAGHADNTQELYLRTVRSLSGGSLKLQIAAKIAFTATRNIIFKFRKMI